MLMLLTTCFTNVKLKIVVSVVVAQLAHQSLLYLEVLGLNPVIKKNLCMHT